MNKKVLYTVMLVLAVVITLGVIKGCPNPVVQHEIKEVHDTTLQVVVRSDTIRLKNTAYDTVWGQKLDNSPCPPFQFLTYAFNGFGEDTISGIANCQISALTNLSIRRSPIVFNHTDTLWRIADRIYERTVTNEEPTFSVYAQGEYELLSKELSGGAFASVRLGNLKLFAGPAYDKTVQLKVGTTFTIWSK